jgi:hypothetical protein
VERIHVKRLGPYLTKTTPFGGLLFLKKPLAIHALLAILTPMKTIHTDNNETLSKGIFPQADGTFLALTFSASKVFKTLAGAQRWMVRRA